MFGALTTYWKVKDKDADFINFWLHGFGIAFAMLPYAIATGHYIGFGIRCILLPFAVAFWATKMNRPVWRFSAVVVNEGGRGFWIILTLPLITL
jgi:hypothetical protein